MLSFVPPTYFFWSDTFFQDTVDQNSEMIGVHVNVAIDFRANHCRVDLSGAAS